MKEYNNIYFIGIGGIGMSAIARYYKFKGKNVSGYDKTASELTHALESEDISIHYEDNIDYIPQNIKDTLVIYTPAIPEDMNELSYVNSNGYHVIKRSCILGEITKGQECLAIAGTHGKTTTSTITAHIITSSQKGCSAFLGGISKNYGTNLLMSHTPTVVVEADEFDRSFLQLYPEIALITSMDADHLDIYKDTAHYVQAFKEFANQVSCKLIVKYGLDITNKDTKAEILTYHYTNTNADFHTENASPDELGYIHYDIVYPTGIIRDVKVGAPGWINAENCLGAAAICLCHGISEEDIKKAIGSFSGVKRRLELHINTPTISYIDDYAHHPEELESSISSMRNIFSNRKITGIFQPHLYSRTKDFADGFAKALSQLDKVILLDIYPAREEPIPGVTSELIFNKITAPEKVLLKKEELIEYLENEKVDVLATFGAGNIDKFIEPITLMLKKRLK